MGELSLRELCLSLFCPAVYLQDRYCLENCQYLKYFDSCNHRMLLQDGQIEIRWRFSTVSYGSASSGRLQKRQFLKFKIFEYIFYLCNVCILSISIRHIYLVDHILYKYIFNITILTHELMCNLFNIFQS